MSNPKAIILLSGGLDSTTCLAVAKSQNFDCYTLSFNYGQRHLGELAASKAISAKLGAVRHIEIAINLNAWGGSSLTDHSMKVPTAGENNGIPNTYVPARNLIFLSFATAWAEVLGARDIFIGVNSMDYSGYPDCRAKFIESFRHTAKLATKAADENWEYQIHAPLQSLTKAEIIKLGSKLGVDYADTVSCYQLDARGYSCGVCDSCRLRHKGFEEAGVPDPTKYRR